MDFNPKKIERKWQKLWEEKKVFQTKEDSKKKKYYCCEFWPYPSGSGLHMGHAFNYTIGDIFARFKRMNGFNVLHPMGFDAFGLPAENAAIKAKSHPKTFTENAITMFIKQQKALGLSYDWSRMAQSCDPKYYKWNQFFFLKLFENDLIYRKKAPVNWCPECNTVLANEQVHNGKCWRHKDTNVKEKELEQWFIKTTAYANELNKCIEKLDWPHRIKIMQKNWISRKEWIDITYSLDNSPESVVVSTTRPDTNFGATFVVMAPEHPLLSKEKNLVPPKFRKAVDEYILAAKKKTEEERLTEGKKKTGVFTGLYCINNLTKKKMPIWVTDFVLLTVGTGAVVGVPGHDKRDFEFAKEFDLPIVRVVVGKDKDTSPITKKEQVQEHEGTMIHSGFLDGLDIHKATKKVMDYLVKKGVGKRTIRYRLKDWLVSRQRYWGTPIPMIYCDSCNLVPVSVKDLPVLLPEKVSFGKGNPLTTNKSFVNVKCPKCKSSARRETDTMDTFFDSSWYFLRYLDANNKKLPFEKKKANYWLPVDAYIGGAEHACMHLIYARFFTKALRDLGFLSCNEPFTKLFNQGMLHGEDGHVMAKSRGNVIDPLDTVSSFGADALRLFLVSVASPDKDFAWSSSGLDSIVKVVKKLAGFFESVKISKSNKRVESKVHKTIRGVTENISKFQYNFAVIKLRQLVDDLSVESEIAKKDAEIILKLFHPFCPHLTEELWEKLKNKPFLSLSSWPVCDPKKIDKKLEQEEELVSKTQKDILRIKELANLEKPKVFLYCIPPEVKIFEKNKNFLAFISCSASVTVFASNDKHIVDPEKKAKKAKPGRPSLYLE